MTKFDIACDYVLENEKGLANIPGDSGKLTNWGISQKFIESLKDDDELPSPNVSFFMKKKDIDILFYIKMLKIEQAKWIYQRYFWLPIYDQIKNQDICNFIFDMTVQHGKKKAAELTQRAINAAAHDTKCIVDGNMGVNTMAALKTCLTFDKHGSLLLSCLTEVRESLFRCIVAMHPEKSNCLNGWLNRCYR